MEYLIIKEIESELKVCDETIYRWIRTGIRVKGETVKLTAAKAGRGWRVLRSELDLFLLKSCQ